MDEVTAPVCPLSLAANALRTVVSESWRVECFEVFQHDSGRFYVSGELRVIQSFWPFDRDECEHRVVEAHRHLDDHVFCRSCYRYVPVKACEAGNS
jgi:hypothetical protein